MLAEQPPVRHVGWDGHLLLLHGSETERRATLAAWVRRGLDRDEKVICAEAEGQAPGRTVRAVLERGGVDVVSATAKRRLVVLPLAEFYAPGGHARAAEQALAEGYWAVRMSAEAAPSLAVLPEHAYAEYEHTMDELCRTRPVSALCQYEESKTTDDGLRRVISRHVDGIRHRQLSTGGSDGGLALAGELDMADEKLVMYTLQAATETASATFWLDLGGVSFISASGCRALLAGTAAFRNRGGYLLLVAPRPQVRKVLRIIGIAELPRVELVGSQR